MAVAVFAPISLSPSLAVAVLPNTTGIVLTSKKSTGSCCRFALYPHVCHAADSFRRRASWYAYPCCVPTVTATRSSKAARPKLGNNARSARTKVPSERASCPPGTRCRLEKCEGTLHGCWPRRRPAGAESYAVKAARMVLNGGDEEMCCHATRLVPIQLQ